MHDNEHDDTALTLGTICEFPNGRGQIDLEERRADLRTFVVEHHEII
jgi:hypothetical protein